MLICTPIDCMLCLTTSKHELCYCDLSTKLDQRYVYRSCCHLVLHSKGHINGAVNLQRTVLCSNECDEFRAIRSDNGHLYSLHTTGQVHDVVVQACQIQDEPLQLLMWKDCNSNKTNPYNREFSCTNAVCNTCPNETWMQALYQALQMSVSLGMCI